MNEPRRPRIRPFKINQLAPNILTVLALCAGLTAIRLALLGRFQQAAGAIVVAAVLDGLDGRLARFLKGATKFGAELDSLSDFVSFGVAPAVLLYLWSLHDIGGLGWAVVLIFAVCCALRLARFNTALEDPSRPSWQYNFFTGVPAPAGAMALLLFVFVSFNAGDTFWRNALLNGAWGLGIAFLMISRLPSFSFKKVRVPRDYVLALLLVVAALAALFMSFPWETLTGLVVLYLLGLPIAFRSYARLRREHIRPEPEEPELVETETPAGPPDPPSLEP